MIVVLKPVYGQSIPNHDYFYYISLIVREKEGDLTQSYDKTAKPTD